MESLRDVLQNGTIFINVSSSRFKSIGCGRPSHKFRTAIDIAVVDILLGYINIGHY